MRTWVRWNRWGLTSLAVMWLACSAQMGRAQGIASTFAGSDWLFAGENGPAANAQFVNPLGVAGDSRGNLFLADNEAHTVLKVSPSGSITVLAGTGIAAYSGDGGPAAKASLSFPRGLAVDDRDNVYIADWGNYCVRKVTPQGVISTVASASGPEGLATDRGGNLYIADTRKHRIIKVDSNGGTTTVAGTGVGGFFGDEGPASLAQLNYPNAVAVDLDGSIYIADWFNARVRRIDPAGRIHTFLGGGSQPSSATAPATSIRMSVVGVAVDGLGSVYAVDVEGHRIVRVTNGVSAPFAGNGAAGFSGDGGPAPAARLNSPYYVATDRTGALLIADSGNRRFRRVSTANVISTFAGNGLGRFSGDGGQARNAVIARAHGVDFDGRGNVIVADTRNNLIRSISREGIITTLAGNGSLGSSGNGGPARAAALSAPLAVACDRRTGEIYFAEERLAGVHAGLVRKITADGRVMPVAGGGSGGDGELAVNAGLYWPYDVAVDGAGNVFIADAVNHRLRKVAAADGRISTVAGGGDTDPATGLTATRARFSSVSGVALDPAMRVCFSDKDSGVIYRVESDGRLTILTRASSPERLAFDRAGNLYIGGAYVIWKLDQSGGLVPFAGGGSVRTPDGKLSTTLELGGFIGGMVADSDGSLLVAAREVSRIIRIHATPPALLATPGALQFTAASQGPAPAEQAVLVTSTIPGMTFAAASSSPWVRITPSEGFTPATIRISPDPAALSPGSYSATIGILPAEGIGAAASLSLQTTVTAAAAAKLAFDRPTLSLSAAGAQTAVAEVAILNQGGGSPTTTVTAEVDAETKWLAVTPGSGTVPSNNPLRVAITVDSAGLSAGIYTGRVRARGTAGDVALPVTLTVRADRPSLLISQSGLTFTAVSGGPGLPPQKIVILNSGSRSMSWSAAAAVRSSGPAWLSVNQTSGTLARPFVDSASIEVAANPAGLAPGEYYGDVQIASAGADGSPRSVVVVLNVLPPGSELGPIVMPVAVTFSSPVGRSPGAEDVLITNPSPSAASFTASSLTEGGNWIQFVPQSASIPPGGSQRLTIQPDYSGLSAGARRAVVTLLFNDQARSVRTIPVFAVATAASDGGLVGTNALRRSDPCLDKLTAAFQEPSKEFEKTADQPAKVEVKVVDKCGKGVTSGAVAVSFSTREPALLLAHIGNGVWSKTWQPKLVPPGEVTLTATAVYAQGEVHLVAEDRVSGRIRSGSVGPAVVPGGVLNAASFLPQALVAPGGLISIFGERLAAGTPLANPGSTVTRLGDTEVMLAGRPLPLLYVSANQINAQTPFELPTGALYDLVVRRGSTSSLPQEIAIAEAQPAIYTQDQSGTGAGTIVNGATNELVSPRRPAKAGDTVVIYCNGLGAVSPAVPSGGAAPLGGPLSWTTLPVRVLIGGIDARVNFAGLTPGFPGLYQVNAVVPAGLPPGNSSVVLKVGNNTGPPVSLAIQ